MRSEEHRERLRMLQAEIEMRYADQLATASIMARWRLRWRMRKEFHREADRLRPSSRSV
jgi:hypothetical protein